MCQKPIREGDALARVLGLAILAASTLVTVACIGLLIRTVARMV